MKNRYFRIAAITIAFVLCCITYVTLLTSKPIAYAEELAATELGKLNYSDGSKYEGGIENGMTRNGTGTFTWSTGESYEGTWINDIQTGTGKMIWPGLGVYEGEFLNGKRQGHGIFTWTYENEPEAGKPISFEGEWENDRIGSAGKMTFANLGIYEGEFSGGLRSGKGTFTWDNGDQYYGVWADDRINGDGILTLMDGSTVLEGKFANNVLSKGTVTYAVEGGTATRNVLSGKTQAGVTIVYQDNTKVVGNLKGKEFTGNVTITYASGDMYVGTLSNGLKAGKGIYTWKSGAHYTGAWANDKMHGTGKYYYEKDEKTRYLSGSFVDGLPSGTLVYVSEKKLQYNTVWKDGKCTSITYKKN